MEMGGQAATRASVKLLRCLYFTNAECCCVCLLHCKEYVATDNLQASPREKPEASGFQFKEDSEAANKFFSDE